MLLAVDVGNTQTHLGAFDGEELVSDWRVGTVSSATADELAGTISRLLELDDLSFESLDGAIVSTVVPQLGPEYEHLTERYMGRACLLVGPTLKTGMPILVDNPHELGADRLVNAVAVHAKVNGACVAVDFGTSTNFDVVDEEGSYCGGVIAPGINLSIEALVNATALLPRIIVEKPKLVIGTTTVACMHSGVFWGYVGLIEGLVARIKAEFGRPMKVVSTGGLAPVFDGSTSVIEQTVPDITARGLIEIFKRSKA
jgi:type III pantothenate kinase